MKGAEALPPEIFLDLPRERDKEAVNQENMRELFEQPSKV